MRTLDTALTLKVAALKRLISVHMKTHNRLLGHLQKQAAESVPATEHREGESEDPTESAEAGSVSTEGRGTPKARDQRHADEKSLSELKKNEKAAKRELKKLRDEYSSLQSEITDFTRKNKRLESEKKKLDISCDYLRSDVKKLNAEKEMLTSSQGAIKKEINRLKSNLAAHKKSKIASRTESEEARKAARKAADDAKEDEKWARREETRLKDAKSRREKLAKEADELEASVSLLQASIATLKISKEALESEKTALSALVSGLEAVRPSKPNSGDPPARASTSGAGLLPTPTVSGFGALAIAGPSRAPSVQYGTPPWFGEHPAAMVDRNQLQGYNYRMAFFNLRNCPPVTVVSATGRSTRPLNRCDCNTLPADRHRVKHGVLQGQWEVQHHKEKITHDVDPFVVYNQVDDLQCGYGMATAPATYQLTGGANPDMSKRHVLFLDLSYASRIQIAPPERTLRLRYDTKTGEFRVMDGGNSPPIQDWREHVRAYEEKFGCVVWHASFRSEYPYFHL